MRQNLRCPYRKVGSPPSDCGKRDPVRLKGEMEKEKKGRIEGRQAATAGDVGSEAKPKRERKKEMKKRWSGGEKERETRERQS